ncbi:uncharacterized protein LOC109594448 isoform X2 [Aethina tumida]|uniref:uncharacterized protein LOC109594448 isoform X2 n=1 Tax=Aethina tumida TaxID=116153 RepID=UPI00214928C8|nr:uncharacterized protein LOC109594448 isoform X2 [Aethina tumida]
MDSSNTVCPVCTLYLRPGITLKSHLASHPKQKVIEALVKLSAVKPDHKLNDSVDSDELDLTSPSSSQVNNSLNQSWGQSSSSSSSSSSMNIPPNMGPMQGNHLFIYQQSMSTTSPQGNVLNINPLSQQYVIPTVFNPQMMPYVYQQQHVILSSNSCVPPLRALPFELPSTSNSSEQTAVITEAPNEEGLSTEQILEKEDEDRECAKIEEFTSTSTQKDSIIEIDDEEKQEKIEEEESKICKETESMSDEEDENVENYTTEYELECDTNIDHEEFVDSPKSVHEGEWDTQFHPDLNKACQTQTTTNSSPLPNSSMLGNLENNSFPEHVEEPPPEYYYIDQNIPTTSYTSSAFEQSDPIYTSTNILQSNDFMDMDGMQVIINDFNSAPIISHVDHPDLVPESSADLMTIGDMVSKNDYSEHRDFDESISRESSNVNMRTDERMPPRGELSGQESIGGASDIAWNRVQYQEGTSGMSTNSYHFMARETWEASDSSDVDVPPLQSRNPANFKSEIDNDIDNDTPTIVSFSGPPLNFKCSTCGEDFASTKDRKEHEMEKHPEKRKSNLIGAEIGKNKVKKLIIKTKVEKAESENNFDNVFTNKLKLETQAEGENMELSANPEAANTPGKVESGNVSVKILCSICDTVLESVKALRTHKLEVHNVAPDIRHICTTCGQPFQNEFKFTEHLRVHPLECRMCGKLFYRRQNFQLHIKRHLGLKPYKCELCEKCFITKQKYNEHKNTHTGDAPIKCTLCNDTFRRHSNLVQHRNRHHFNIKKKVKDYICSCGEIFHSKKKLAWHKEIHDAKPKSCTKCSEKFIHMSSLTRHMRRAHNENFLPSEERNSENVECPICKGVYLRSSLEIHIRNHSGARPYTCLICNKNFTTKWNLKMHKWTHSSRTSKPFKCDQCKGAFIRESDYIAHMNSHKSVRPYTCNYCGAQFIRKYNCQRHVKEHENDLSS